MRWAIASLGLLVLAGSAVGQPASEAPPAQGGRGAAPRVLKFSLAPKPSPLTPWAAPNRPHYKLADITAAHARQLRWSQTVVRDQHFTGSFIQMAPGEKTKRLFYPDNEIFFVVQSGQMRVHVDGLEPFLAGKSVVVQVPARTAFHVETVGDVPALRFEVVHTGMLPIYADNETPDPVPGQPHVRIAYAAPATPPKLDPTTVYIDFDKDIVQGGGRAGRWLKAGSFIRGMTIPTPPRDDLGHWHTETSEFYFIMEGQQDFQLEGIEPFIAVQGDVIYVPFGRYHRNNFTGGGMATRLAIFPAGNINNLDPENPSRQAP
jgi:mannose-6-phosphate isomerase-like protein (cupin superfamily)